MPICQNIDKLKSKAHINWQYQPVAQSETLDEVYGVLYFQYQLYRNRALTNQSFEKHWYQIILEK